MYEGKEKERKVRQCVRKEEQTEKITKEGRKEGKCSEGRKN